MLIWRIKMFKSYLLKASALLSCIICLFLSSCAKKEFSDSLDCSAISTSSDYIQVSTLVDSTLFITQKDKVNGNKVVNAINELNSYNANVVGTVLTY